MPELRLFISSTFQDLQEEREHLVKKIFPEIRALCRQRGVTFTEVDLRWGITEEEAQSDGIIRICLSEIDRSRPFFIGILGERYGWTPSGEEALRVVDDSPQLAAAVNDGASITEMEIVHGVLANPAMSEHAFFYLRDRASTPDEFADNDAESIQRLNDLKDRIRRSGFPVRENYRDPAELGMLIEADLRGVIDEEYPESEAPDDVELERRAHAAFAASRRRAYVANEEYLKDFGSWLSNEDVAKPSTVMSPQFERGRPRGGRSHQSATRNCLAITGNSGLGKSSLMAYLVEQYRCDNPTAFIIEHYVGASQTSGSATSVIRHIVEEIRRRFSISDPLPSNPKELEKGFSNWLFRVEHYAKQLRIEMLIAIDAVNQLDEAGRRLTWLPKAIPVGVRLLLSTTPGECAEHLAERSWPLLEVTPIDTESTREQIVQRYLGEFRKSITSAQMHRLVSDAKASSPLYLRLVAEELRLHGEHETLDAMVERYSAADDLLNVFDQVLERMERDYSQVTVQGILSLIGASRSGLSELELLELTGISRIDLSRLLFALDYHLIRRDGMLGFFHDYLRRAVQKRYILDEGTQRSMHLHIANYFQSGITASIVASEIVPLRMADEQAYQLHAAGAIDRLRECLSTIPIFLSLYQSQRQYEVLAYWSAMEDMSDIEESYRTGLHRWRVEDARRRSIGLGMVANLLQRMGHWSGAIEIERERLASAIHVGDRSEEAASRVGLGQTLQMRRENSEAMGEFEKARDIYIELGDRSGVSRTIGNVGVIHYRRGEYDRALESYRVQLNICEGLGDRAGIAKAIGNMGGVYYNRGEYDRALECYQQKLNIGEELGDRDGISAAIGNMGGVYYGLGEYECALQCYQRKLIVDEELGDRAGVATALGNMGLVYADRREYDRALECQQRQLSIGEELGDRHGVAIATGNMGMVYASLGKYERALESYDRQLSICEELGDPTGVAIAIGNIGPVYADLGEHDRALECYERQLSICEELGDRRSIATAIGNIGLVYAGLGKYGRALESLHRSIEEHRAAGLRYGLTYCLEGLGRVLVGIVGAGDDTHLPRSMPDYLPKYIPGATAETWYSMTLRRARVCAEECIAISEELAIPDMQFSGQVLLARVEAEEGHRDLALQRFTAMLSDATGAEDSSVRDEDRAALYHWLWRVGRTEEHRRESLRLYQALGAMTSIHEYHKRIEELRASGE